MTPGIVWLKLLQKGTLHPRDPADGECLSCKAEAIQSKRFL